MDSLSCFKPTRELLVTTVNAHFDIFHFLFRPSAPLNGSWLENSPLKSYVYVVCIFLNFKTTEEESKKPWSITEPLSCITTHTKYVHGSGNLHLLKEKVYLQNLLRSIANSMYKMELKRHLKVGNDFVLQFSLFT